MIPLDHAVDIRSPSEWTAADALQQHVENGVVLAALYDGIGRAARAWLVEFLRTRVPSSIGKPLATCRACRRSSAVSRHCCACNTRLVDSFVSEIDAGSTPAAEDAHVIKSVVTNNVIQAIEAAMSLCGNHGLTRANPLERHYRDALCGARFTPRRTMRWVQCSAAPLSAEPRRS